MSNVTDVNLALHLVHGEPIRFKLRRSDYDLMNAPQRIEEAMESKFLGIVMQGDLVLVPSSNIARIEISPAPEGLLRSTIRDAEPLD
jgi:hypothetical protein